MSWVCTTPKEPMAALQPRTSTAGLHLTLGSKAQTIRGFGACFSELGYMALCELSREKREEVMRELFSPSRTGFTFCRMPIGANDFAASWYSLDETEGDYALAHFSLERDRGTLIPYIHEAQRFAPDLELFASPWSPPSWMKQPPVYNYGRLKTDERTQSAYAEYFVRALKQFAAEGVHIRRLCVQNEVFADAKYASCLWSGEQMRDFIRDYLGPRLAQSGMDTELWLGTVNGPYIDYEANGWHGRNLNDFITKVMLDERAAAYIKGVALQWGGKHLLEEFHAQYPDVEMIQSECECGDGSNQFRSVFYVFHLMWQYFHAGATAFTYWNLALKSDTESTWGWKQNALVSVDAPKGEYRWNPEFYVMKHLSAYVKPGARYLPVEGRWAANTLAFQNADDSVVCVTVNPLEQEIALNLCGECYSLPPQSLHTIVLRG